MKPEVIYVVMCLFNDQKWGIADFWDLPFASTRYRTAVKMKRSVEARQRNYQWKYPKSKVVKVQVRP